MKRFLMTIAFTAFSMAISAQSLNVSSAIKNMKMGRLDKAKSEIDAACLHEETKGDAKTWFYKAFIYASIGYSKKENLAPDWADQAYAAAIECRRLDTKKEFAQQVNDVFRTVAKEYYNIAIDALNKKNYATAIEYAEKSIAGFDNSDNSTYAQDARYIAGMSSIGTRDTANIIKYFNQMIDKKTDNYYVYKTMFRIYEAKGDNANAMKVATSYKKNNENDYLAYLMLADGYLLDNNVKKSKEQVNIVLNMTKNSANLYPLVLVLSGDILEKCGDFDGAIAKYSESLTLKPNQFEANNSLGTMYYNRAVDKTNAAYALDPFDESLISQYNKLMDEARKLFRQSITYMENALAYYDGLTDENDKTMMRTHLINILIAMETSYTRVDMLDKANAIKARREELLKQQ